MRKTVILALLLAGAALSSELNITQKSSVYLGASFPIRNKGDYRRIGANGGFATYTQFDKYFGVGAQLEYTWQSIDLSKDTSEYIKKTLNYWDVALTLKGITHFAEYVSFYGEIAPGFYLGMTAKHTDHGDDYKPWVPDFGLSFGTGFLFGTVVLAWKFKVAFTEERTTRWITVTVGLCG